MISPDLILPAKLAVALLAYLLGAAIRTYVVQPHADFRRLPHLLIISVGFIITIAAVGSSLTSVPDLPGFFGLMALVIEQGMVAQEVVIQRFKTGQARALHRRA